MVAPHKECDEHFDRTVFGYIYVRWHLRHVALPTN